MRFPSRIQSVIDAVEGLRGRVEDHWQIPGDEARVLAQLVTIGRCVSICEIGTSYGFSTLHLAAATQPMGGHVHTFDIDPKKVDAAGKHLEQAGLRDVVTQHLGDARQLLLNVTPMQPFDFVFIDAVKEQSFAYLEAVQPRLASRAVIVTDNTTTHAAELASFVEHLRGLPNAQSCAVPVGNGFELTVVGVTGG